MGVINEGVVSSIGGMNYLIIFVLGFNFCYPQNLKFCMLEAH